MLKVSIVTVSYNSAKTIEDTIRSVLSQDYRNCEYILVDGGSTDSTLDIIRKYEPMFNGRMRWISEKDNGLYDAMNKGIRMATGNIVGIINSDDFFCRSNAVSIIAGAFEDESVRAVYADVRYVRPGNLNRTVRYYSSGKWKASWFRFGFMPAHPTFYTYRENFDKYGYYRTDYRIGADFELMVRHLHTNRVPSKYIPLDLLNMRTGGISTSGLKAKWILCREDARACRENGIWTCLPLIFCKFFIKVFEFVPGKNC